MTEVVIPLSGEAQPAATLKIRTLPGQELWKGLPQLQWREAVLNEGFHQASVQLLEEAEYDYSIKGCGDEVDLEPVEIFDRSDSSGLNGRLRPRGYTGTVNIQVRRPDSRLIGQLDVEVRSRKLDYLSEYRWMVQRIADEAAEAVQSYFAAGTLTAFRPSGIGEAETLYQRFAFLHSLLGSSEFQDALGVIQNRPHHAYETVSRWLDPARGIKGSPSVAQALIRPGPRRVAPATVPLSSLPEAVEQSAHQETLDTLPNRFVKHAITQWRYLAREVAETSVRRPGPAGRRGAIEAAALEERLDEVLRAPMFKDVGPLRTFPRENTVLQRRPGYRDVLRAYLQLEAAALVDWAGGLDSFGAGQRDVAILYEYWVYLELARIVDTIPNFGLDHRPLFKRAADKLSLELRRGSPSVLRGSGRRRGHDVAVELWFNRQFRAGGESWSEPMRPDASLRIVSEGVGAPRSKWLHFDAKYRVDSYRQVFQVDASSGGEHSIDIREREAKPVTEDVLKMHAYRDAISKTSGAFILYPGFDELPVHHAPYHEILPGLGAFVLRPTESGRADPQSASHLRHFIEDAIDHLAAIGTDEDRATFWRDRVYAEARGVRLGFEEWVDRPPADMQVLLGFVRGPEHLRWIEERGLYNLRADEQRRGSIGLDSPELAADLVCLYDESSADIWMFSSSKKFVLRTARDLLTEGYPYQPGGDLYCCLLLDKKVNPPVTLNGGTIRNFARVGRQPEDWAAPRCERLDDLLLGEKSLQ